VYEKKGYAWDTFNVFGIRAVKTGEGSTNQFVDAIGYAYYDARTSRWEYVQFEGATGAGLYYALQPDYTYGTALLKEGFYPNCYAVGLYKGIYESLLQVEPMDYDAKGIQNGKLTMGGETKSGIIDAHIHLAHDAQTFRNVGAYSSACQIVSTPSEFNQMMSVCKYFALKEKKRFSYALFTLKDVEDAFTSLRQTPKKEEPKRKDTILGETK
jgi:hypothetical protein